MQEINYKALTEEDWKERLTSEQYYILRQKGTEPPFSGKYDNFYQPGKYVCSGCGTTLFTSEQKFKSGCGWPSFDDSIPNTVEMTPDYSHGMIRTEITCKNCGGHLGHIFDDGPTVTGQRYCVNSLSIEFIQE